MSALYGIASYDYGVNRDEYYFSVVSDGEKVEILVDPSVDAPEEYIEGQKDIFKAMEYRLANVSNRSPEEDLEAISYNMPFSITVGDEYKSFDDAMEYAKNNADLRAELMFDGRKAEVVSLSPRKTEDEEEKAK